ncbi:CvfB family protein [Haloferula sargassicola]|uniref:Conserved virulence factor B n=1 Tax=Haloferula sargassicola TaxID=490096 RepID=A0ABP9UJM3_9BACT
MADLGDIAMLRVVRERKYGLGLDSEGPLGEVLLPRAEMPDTWEIGGLVSVFLYTDSDDRPIATTRRPKAKPGEFAALKVVATTNFGAFLDWGLTKDLLLPFGEQKTQVRTGHRIVVRVEVDEESGRIIASQKLGRYLEQSMRPPFVAGDEVEALVYARTELGYKAVVNGRYGGLIYQNEVFQPVRPGDRLTAFVSLVRPDGKLDLALQAKGRAKIDDFEADLLRYLQRLGGFSPLSDRSPAGEIHDELGVSKKTFKQAVGALYRKRKITVSDEGIRLVGQSDWSPGEE